MSAETLKGIWLDRDLTWLEFNRRVLAEALDDRTPLLERFKFLAIFTSNLDEFFMKRVALLRVENDGTHTRLLTDLRAVIVAMVQQQQACFASLLPQLEQHGIRILGWKDLTDRQRLESTKFFRENVLPALTPLVVAYEPVWAIGTGRTATPEIAEEAHTIIRNQIAQVAGSDIAASTRILYGGSVKPDNARALCCIDDIDGALVGGASLDPLSFSQIIINATQ